MRAVASLALLGVACAALPAAAADPSVERRLDAQGFTYKIDSDGDYAITYEFTEDGRTQLVFVAGRTQSVSGFTVRKVFAPAAAVEQDGVTGEMALDLLKSSGNARLGSWEIIGDTLYFMIKLPDSASAKELEVAMNIVAAVADETEIKISGDRDNF